MIKRTILKKRNLSKQNSRVALGADEFFALYEVNKSITSTLQLAQVLKLITKNACCIMKAHGCSLRLLHSNKKELILKAHYRVNKRLHLRKGNIKVGESIAGRVLKENNYYIVKDLFANSLYQDNSVVRKANFRSLLSVPLSDKDKVLGVLSIYSKRRNFFKEDDAKLLFMFAAQASIALVNAHLYEQVRANYIDTIRFLANALDAKDSYTAGHSERVAKIALGIARQLNFSNVQKDTLQYAGYLHDLGKVTVNINILRKQGPLNEEEWEVMYRHPQVGVEIIKRIAALSNLAPIILHHHARYSGGGYPDKSICSHKIPIGSRIIAVADAYEAMVSQRSYRKAFSKQQARKELRRCSGTQFDPKIVEAFLESEETDQN